MGGHLISGYIHLKRGMSINWLDRCHKTQDLKTWSDELLHKFHLTKGFESMKLRDEWEQIEKIKDLPDQQKDWRDIYHVFLFPVYGESYDVLNAAVKSCLDSSYPKDKIILLYTVEERGGPQVLENVQRLANEYRDKFKDIIVTVHPDGIVGEMKGCGSNGYWGAKVLEKYVAEWGVKHEDLLVHYFDCDTLAHKQYLACVTYNYIIHPDRTYKTYQPIPLFNNNLWDVPAINRLVALGSSYWQLIESTRPYRLVNFSSQAMSFKTLVDIDFYDRFIVSDDSKQFYRAYYHYNGDHKVVPIFTPVSMDAVLGKDVWDTIKAQYIQKRRWAWGIEHFPYLMEKFFSTRGQLSFKERIIHPFRTFEGHVSWATSSLIIALGVWWPLLLNADFRMTVLAFNLPYLARVLLSITWIGVVISAMIAYKLLPPRPKQYNKYKNIEMLAQWLLVPISGIFFGSIPALDAEMRLLFGKYLGFAVTAKERKSQIDASVVNETTA